MYTGELIEACFEDWACPVEAMRNATIFVDWLYAHGYAIIKNNIIENGDNDG